MTATLSLYAIALILGLYSMLIIGVQITLVDKIFIFWLKWLSLRQFAYADNESETLLFYHVRVFQNLHFKFFALH